LEDRKGRCREKERDTVGKRRQTEITGRRRGTQLEDGRDAVGKRREKQYGKEEGHSLEKEDKVGQNNGTHSGEGEGPSREKEKETVRKRIGK